MTSVKVLVAPVLHPAAISRGQFPKEPAQQTALRRVAEVLKGTRQPNLVDINEPPPDTLLFPSVQQVKEFVDETLRRTAGCSSLVSGDQGNDGGSPNVYDSVAVDIENAGRHIICIGLTQLGLESGRVGRTICVRFRRRGGAKYWSSRSDLASVVESLDDLFGRSGVGLVFHNGVGYDVPVLREIGFRVEGRLLDTLLMMHTAYPEMPKSLQFCSTLFLWAPVWKSLVDESDEEEGKG